MLSNEDRQKALDSFNIVPLPKPIMEMSLKEIREHFGYATTDGIKKTILMSNLIWQIYNQIQAGYAPDFYKKHGFIRGMWYYIKKKFTKHHPLRGDMYGIMSKQLTLMVKAGLFTYSDFNFRDRDADTWKLGFDNPHIILAAEKDGFITIIEELQNLYGCHSITLGGVPSFMTINYMVAEMKKYEIDINQEFVVFTFCDFDPAGYNVADELINHLKNSGVKKFYKFDQWGKGRKKRPWLELAVPDNFDRKINQAKYRLPKSVWDNPTTKEWVKLTGGLDKNWRKGKVTHGLESDEFDFDLIMALFETNIVDFLKDSSDIIKKRNAMKTVRKSLEDMAIVKFLQRLKENSPEINMTVQNFL